MADSGWSPTTTATKPTRKGFSLVVSSRSEGSGSPADVAEAAAFVELLAKGASLRGVGGHAIIVRRPRAVRDSRVGATVALVAGLFGTQRAEGAVEGVINMAVAAVPLIGATFLRQRVAAKSRLTSNERARLFGRKVSRGIDLRCIPALLTPRTWPSSMSA